jgi:hypothetical protein
MDSSVLQHFPLKFAYLCPDCNSIGNCATQCPACASKSLMGLSAILDREEHAGMASLTFMSMSNSESSDERPATMAA